MATPRSLESISRGCTNKEVRKILMKALRAGCRYKKIKSGITLYGDGGERITVHFTTSDRRGAKNLLAELRKANIKGIE